MLRSPLRRRGPIYIIIKTCTCSWNTLAVFRNLFILCVGRLYFSERKTYKFNICSLNIDFGNIMELYYGRNPCPPEPLWNGTKKMYATTTVHYNIIIIILYIYTYNVCQTSHRNGVNSSTKPVVVPKH